METELDNLLSEFGDIIEHIEPELRQGIIDFAFKMCELQKQECYTQSTKEGAFGTYTNSDLVDRESILTVKNVINGNLERH